MRESLQFPSAVAKFARPEEYASFEFSAHHGAICSFARFQVFRSEYADQLNGCVSSWPPMP
jgi:hypothetical protein